MSLITLFAHFRYFMKITSFQFQLTAILTKNAKFQINSDEKKVTSREKKQL